MLVTHGRYGDPTDAVKPAIVSCMANPEQLALLKRGAATWNTWRWTRGASSASDPMVLDDRADLSGFDLRFADFRSVDLSGADLRFADFRSTDLSGADLHAAFLSGANLSEAYLVGTNFSEADLTAADLRGANIIQANFIGANFSGADVSSANVANAIFGNIDLRGIKGLESIRHHGPSTIGIDTIYKSNGEIPEAFLRGAGVPEQFITYARSLVGQAIEFYSCFISHSTKDQDFAVRLHADLQSKGVRCWFAPHSIQGGKKIHEQIDEAIRVYDKLLLVLSDHSMKSEWVNTEIATARKREIRDKRRMLFPVRLVAFETMRDWECFDADTGKDSAREIREYFIPDFSRWKDHDSYQAAFARLLSDLKAEGNA